MRGQEGGGEGQNQLEQAKLAHELKKTEMEAREDPKSEDEKDAGPTIRGNRGPQNLARQTKRFGDTMRHVLPKMPQESAEFYPNSLRRSKNFT